MTYSFNRRRGVQGCMVASMLALAALFIGVGAIFPVRPLGWFAMAFGALIAGLTLVLALDSFTPGPVLTISAEGICFTPFSPATVPWRDVTAVSMRQGYWSNGAGITKPDGKFGFRYTVRDPAAYPKGGGLQAVNRALMSISSDVPLNTATLIDATWQDVHAAFKEHYSGTITEIPVPGFPPANP